MRRSARKGAVGLDPERIVTAAVAAFLDGESGGRRADAAEPERERRRLGRGAVALGVVAGLGARALYRRARGLDIEQVARAVERRIA